MDYMNVDFGISSNTFVDKHKLLTEYFKEQELRENTLRNKRLQIYLLFNPLTLFIILFLIYKLIFNYRHPFWSKQPVFHYHHIHNWLWFRKNRVINTSFSDWYLQNRSYIKNLNLSDDLNLLDNLNLSDVNKLIDNNDIDLVGNDEGIIFHYFSDFNQKQTGNYLEKCHKIVASNYLIQKGCYYVPSLYNMKQVFSQHKNICSISLYIKNKEPISTITTRPNYMIDKTLVKNGILNKKLVYNVDWLTTKKEYQKKGITPINIGTLVYNISNLHKNKHLLNIVKNNVSMEENNGINSKINNSIMDNSNMNDDIIFVFKREGQQTCFIPFTSYNTYIYDITWWNNKNHLALLRPIYDKDTGMKMEYKRNMTEILALLSDYYLMKVERKGSGMSLLSEFLSSNEFVNHWEHILTHCNEHILHMIENDLYHVYLLLLRTNENGSDNNVVMGVYFYRDPEMVTHLDGDKKKQDIYMELIGGYVREKTGNNIAVFQYFFYESLNHLYYYYEEKEKGRILYLIMENISDVIYLQGKTQEYYGDSCVSKQKTGYYYYNYICKPLRSNKVFIL